MSASADHQVTLALPEQVTQTLAERIAELLLDRRARLAAPDSPRLDVTGAAACLGFSPTSSTS